MKIETKALVWRDDQDNILGFFAGDTRTGTQITAEASMDVTQAKWEPVTIIIGDGDREDVQPIGDNRFSVDAFYFEGGTVHNTVFKKDD